MTSTALLAAVLADLAALAADLKGTARIRTTLAKDPFHTLQILSAAPDGLHLVLQDDGDATLPGTPPEDLLLQQSFSVFVAMNLGLKATPAEDLLEDRGDRPSLTGLCDIVRTRVLTRGQTVSNAGNTSYPDYAGRQTVATPDGLPLAAYQIRFTLAYAADALTLRPPGGP